MFKYVLLLVGLSLFLVGVSGLVNTGGPGSKLVIAQQLPGGGPIVVTEAPGPISEIYWSYCSNASGATCVHCTPHGGCTINGAGTLCQPTSAGSAGCAAGPDRAKGTCFFSFVASCPHRDNLCGTAMEPQCFSQPFWISDTEWDCGDGLCAGVAGAGNCSGC
jgi:hypothetical protein